MTNENTPINTGPDSAKQGDSPKQGASNPVNPQPMGEPKRETEQKTAPAMPEKNEPARK